MRRSLVPLVDDKLLLHQRCGQIDVPTPHIFGVVSRFGELAELDSWLAGQRTSSSSPTAAPADAASWSSSRHARKKFVCRAGGLLLTGDELREHLAGILSGFHSLGGLADIALLQQRCGCILRSAR